MESLQYLLNHPFVVLNNVSEVLYEQKAPAYYTRLRSRASGRHRFREDEAKQLMKIFAKFASQITKAADKLNKISSKTDTKKEVLPMSILNIPMLNVKQVLSKVVENTPLNYFRLYDSLRKRTKLSGNELKSIIATLIEFVIDINKHLEQAKIESKSYSFVLGRGSKSHIMA